LHFDDQVCQYSHVSRSNLTISRSSIIFLLTSRKNLGCLQTKGTPLARHPLLRLPFPRQHGPLIGVSPTTSST
jgi:hypothetical protein